jgi:transcriptional regulator with XRE-family HTH domain
MSAKEPNAVDVHVGARIRVRRMMLQLSQEKLAHGLGITFQQVQKYERGINRVGASRLQHIATLLGVPISYFFADDDSSILADADKLQEQADPIISFLGSRLGIELNTAFLKVDDPKIRHSVLQLVKSVAKSGQMPGGNEDSVR